MKANDSRSCVSHGIVALYCIRTNVPFLSLRLWVPREVLFLKVNFLVPLMPWSILPILFRVLERVWRFGMKQRGLCGPAGVVEYVERLDVLAFCSTTFHNFDLSSITACCSLYAQSHLKRKQTSFYTSRTLCLPPPPISILTSTSPRSFNTNLPCSII